MDKWFKEDSGFMRFLNRLAQMMLLNLMMLACFVPIITGGAGICAAYDVFWRDKDMEGTAWQVFWKAFRSNFKKATGLWLVFLVTGVLLGYCFWFMLQNQQAYNPIMILVLLFAAVLWAMAAAWAFPLQSRFENSLFGTVKSAVLFSVGYLPKSLMMALLNLFPLLLFAFNPKLFFFLGWLFLLLWFGFSAFMGCRMIRGPFEYTIKELQLEAEK